MWFSLLPCVDKPQGGRVRLIISIQKIYKEHPNKTETAHTQIGQYQSYLYPFQGQCSHSPIYYSSPPITYCTYPAHIQYVQPATSPYIDEMQDHYRQSAPLSPQIPLSAPPSPQTPPAGCPCQYSLGQNVQCACGSGSLAVTVRRAPKPKPPKGLKKVADWFVYPGQRH